MITFLFILLFFAKVTAENRKLVKPLQEAQSELIELRKKLEYFNKERLALTRVKTQHATAMKELNTLKWETEALRMRCDNLVAERDDLKNKFEQAMLELQQRTGLKNVLLDRKMTSLQKEHERLELVLSEMVKAAGMGQQNAGVKAESVLKNKNERIEDLEYELARVYKAYEDMLKLFKAKMKKYGIPKDELCLKPIRTNLQISLSTGPNMI